MKNPVGFSLIPFLQIPCDGKVIINCQVVNAFQFRLLAALERRHWWYTSTHDLVANTLRVYSTSALRVLDVGCGTGGLARRLSTVHHLTAIDAEPAAIQFAQRRNRGNTRVQFHHMDVDRLEEAGGPETDCITCIDVLYHRNILDWRRAIETFASKLRTGGLLLLQVPAFDCLKGKHDQAVDGARRFQRKEVLGALSQTGFDILLCSHRFSWLFPGLLVQRTWERWTGDEDPSANDLRSFSHFPRKWQRLCNSALLRIALLENECILAGSTFAWGSSLFLAAHKRGS